MDKLPIELLFKILDYCNIQTFLSLKSTCSILYNYCDLYKFKNNIVVNEFTNFNLISKHLLNININNEFIENNNTILPLCKKLYFSTNEINNKLLHKMEKIFPNITSLFISTKIIKCLNFTNLIKLKLKQNDYGDIIDLSNLINLESLMITCKYNISEIKLPNSKNIVKLKIMMTVDPNSMLSYLSKFNYLKLKTFSYSTHTDNTFNSELFEIFNNYPELNSLSLIGCKINNLNKSLCKLPLKFLNLSKNDLTNIPSYLSEITTLKLLNIDSNPIENISSVINNFNFLECLSIKDIYNDFIVLPGSQIKVLIFDTLVTDCINEQALFSNISNICNMRNLTILHISAVYLDIIPSEIYNLVNLTNLNLSKNLLSSVDKKLKNLKVLKKLDLSHNKFTHIVSPIPSMKSIKELNMEYNKIQFINYIEMQNLKHINLINMKGNRLRKITEEMKKNMRF